jgi:hypothetical protein
MGETIKNMRQYVRCVQYDGVWILSSYAVLSYELGPPKLPSLLSSPKLKTQLGVCMLFYLTAFPDTSLSSSGSRRLWF